MMLLRNWVGSSISIAIFTLLNHFCLRLHWWLLCWSKDKVAVWYCPCPAKKSARGMSPYEGGRRAMNDNASSRSRSDKQVRSLMKDWIHSTQRKWIGSQEYQNVTTICAFFDHWCDYVPHTNFKNKETSFSISMFMFPCGKYYPPSSTIINANCLAIFICNMSEFKCLQNFTSNKKIII